MSPKKIEGMADVINALGDAQCLLAEYHRTILKHKDEDLQDIFNPHMAEIAQIWKVLLAFQRKMQKLGFELELELAPFLVCGRKKKHRSALDEDIKTDSVSIHVKDLPGFVKYASKREKRTVSFYFHATRDHTNAVMFKPKSLGKPFIGLHKFDSNGTNRSAADVSCRKSKFPEYALHTNRIRCQDQSDHTCTFWSFHWILWKLTLMARIKLNPLSSYQMVQTSVDSFRAPVFRFWMQEILNIIVPLSKEELKVDIKPVNFIQLADVEWLECQKLALEVLAENESGERCG